jgi:hypothetical protein
MDPKAPNGKPINTCFISQACDPTDLVENPPHATDDCATNGWECGTGLDGCPEPNTTSCGTCPPAGRPLDIVCNASQQCEPCTPDPGACGSFICGTAINSCGQVEVCGSCGTGEACNAAQDACVCGLWSCSYGNNNNEQLDQCDELPGYGLDYAAADAYCQAYMIGGIFVPFNLETICGECDIWMDEHVGPTTSGPSYWSGYCDDAGDAVAPVRKGYAENLSAVWAEDCDSGILYTSAWACEVAISTGTWNPVYCTAWEVP